MAPIISVRLETRQSHVDYRTEDRKSPPLAETPFHGEPSGARPSSIQTHACNRETDG